MIKTPPEMRALADRLDQAAWSLAAIGALFESKLVDQLLEPRTLEQLAAGCPQLAARRIAALLAVGAAHGVVVSEGETHRLADGVVAVVRGPLRATITGDLRSNLMQPLALLDAASSAQPPGWRHTDRTLLRAQGETSTVMPVMLKNMLAPQLGDLAARLERPGAKLLDVGTGVGALAIAACRVFPNLRVVGLDSFEAPLALAREDVARAGLGDRIELRQLAIEDLRDEATYACAWLPAFFIPPDVLPAAIARVASALEPGGWIVMSVACGGDEPIAAAVWELIGDVWGGGASSPAVAEDLLRAAGLREVRTMPGPPAGAHIVVAMRA